MQHMPFFRSVAADDLDALAAAAEEQAVAAGKEIFGHGHPADALFAILLGTVDVTIPERELPVASLGTGQSLGELAFFRREAHRATARTREPTRLARLPFAALDRLLTERPALALTFYRNAASFFAHHFGQMAAELERPYF